MGFAAINAAAHQGRQSRARESLEAQEGRIANDYAIGLRLVEEGRRSEALVGLCLNLEHRHAYPSQRKCSFPHGVRMPDTTSLSHEGYG